MLLEHAVIAIFEGLQEILVVRDETHELHPGISSTAVMTCVHKNTVSQTWSSNPYRGGLAPVDPPEVCDGGGHPRLESAPAPPP